MGFEREPDGYRRGLTLGLTLAEIFVLLLFLLLFMLLALYVGNARSERENTEIGDRVEGVTDENEGLRDRIAEVTGENEGLRDRVDEVTDENEGLRDRIAEVTGENEGFRDRVEEVTDENEGLRDQVEVLGTKIAQIHKQISKGIDPPCWYQVEERQGKRHEKAYYLMNIAVHEDRLRVVLRPSPLGSATDESGESAPTTYEEEYGRLLARAPLQAAGDMSLSAFAEATKPIRSMGENKEIRDYACKFYVSVWDMTGPTKKERWKQAIATIKGSFYVYEVQNDPWPGDVGS